MIPRKMNMFDIAEKLGRIFVETYPAKPIGYNNLRIPLAAQDKHDEAIAILQGT